MRPIRIWLGGVLVALGILWLLDTAGVLVAGPLIGQWWPLAVITLGVLALIADRRLTPGPVVLVLIGTALLVNQLAIIDLGGIVWPVAAIMVGVWLLVDFARQRDRASYPSDRQDVFALLGGSHTSNRSAHFRHANVSAVLGGATLDLREASPEPGARVDALALFGGVDVVVPPTWRVEVSGLPIFGGYQDKTGGQRGLPPDAPVLKVVATAVFGGVDVKNAEPGQETGSPPTVTAAASDLR